MGATTSVTLVSSPHVAPSATIFSRRISAVLSNSYANPAGDTIAIHTLLGIAAADILAVAIDPDATNHYIWDRAAGTIHAIVNVTGAEVADMGDLSMVTVNATVLHV